MNCNVNLVGSWDGYIDNEFKDEMNILGESSMFYTKQISVIVPEIETTQNNFNLFGAQLINDQDRFWFETPQKMAFTRMDIGLNYVEETLIPKNGFYLEYHDLPHLHVPMNKSSAGFLILGKKISDKKYVLNAFRIPFGKAVYTPPNVIHCDSLLTGEWMVAYGVTKNYSTRNIGSKINIETLI